MLLNALKSTSNRSSGPQPIHRTSPPIPKIHERLKERFAEPMTIDSLKQRQFEVMVHLVSGCPTRKSQKE